MHDTTRATKATVHSETPEDSRTPRPTGSTLLAIEAAAQAKGDALVAQSRDTVRAVMVETKARIAFAIQEELEDFDIDMGKSLGSLLFSGGPDQPRVIDV